MPGQQIERTCGLLFAHHCSIVKREPDRCINDNDNRAGVGYRVEQT
jgi:hypothetical protein